MYCSEFPRLYELKDQFSSFQNSENFYFHDFEKTIKNSECLYEAFRALERDLEVLDHEAWEFLKIEVTPLLINKHPERGWHQLINKLNEAKGYKLLQKLGCTQVKFVARSKKEGIETPDLEGSLCGGVVLCEVKTINISAVAISRGEKGGVRDVQCELSELFFNKFDSKLQKAESQLLSYLKNDSCRMIVYFVIDFDERSAARIYPLRTEYIRQLRDHIVSKKSKEIEVKVYDLLP